MFFYLIYISTMNQDFGEAQMGDMLEGFRSWNNENDITGCLLRYEGRFLHYLEGNQVEVLRLFDKIKEDGRHSGVDILSHGDITVREFGPYALAYENFRRSDHRIEFLGLLIGSFIDAPERSLDPNPSSKRFWTATKKLLDPKFSSDLEPSGK